jgi:hypothetical protein
MVIIVEQQQQHRGTALNVSVHQQHCCNPVQASDPKLIAAAVHD